ncbi:MAG: glycosyltransferase family 2 protein [Sphingobacteriales bacterium]|nr:glycosyltransferase family 2 protein [Sphingobacteriales bacterium]
MYLTITAIWIVLQILVGYNLVLPILLYFLYILKSQKAPIKTELSNNADYAIIVTAYEQTDSLAAVVDSLLKLNYLNYIIYIVADKCDTSYLNFQDDKVILLQPKEELKSNIKSHFYAIQNFKRPHNFLTIIDSDNLVDTNYLNELNKWFDKGFKAVQGVRHPKNLDTTYSCLDAARDIYYHFYDGKILFNLNSSATLAGSGMAFDTALYKECLGNCQIQGAGFDKVLQWEIVGRNLQIAFAEEAIVYDEKTSRPKQLVQQRARWINTWFKYFKFGFYLSLKGIKNLSINQLIFGVILLRPPLFIFILLGLVATFINILISPFSAMIWLGSFLLFIISFLVSLLSSKTDSKIYKSLLSIPNFIFFQILSLLKARRANSYSVTTQHFHTDKQG